MAVKELHGGEAGRLSPASLTAIVIALSLALRVVLAASTGFSFDESYDVVAARTVALGYFDHPPLAMWLITAAVSVFGSEANVVVRLPTLLLFAGTTWFIYRFTEALFTPRAGLIAAITLNLSPLFGVFAGTIAVTDGPLLFGLSAAGWALGKAIFQKENDASARYWLLSGFFFGLAALAKYTAFLTIPGLLFFLASTPSQRVWLTRREPYLAAVIAFLVFSPVVIWNLGHGWASMAFQGDRMAFDGIHPLRLLQYFGYLGLFMLPPIWVGLIVSLVQALRRGPVDLRPWFCGCLAVLPIVFFAVVWLVGDRARLSSGYHWAAPGYLFAFPLLGAALADPGRPAQFAKRLLALSTVIVAGLYLAFVSNVLTGWLGALSPRFRDHDPLVADQTDWWEFRAALADRQMLDPQRYFIIAGRYEICFKAEFVLRGALPVVCLTSNPIGRALWTDMPALIGRDGIIITTWWNAPGGVAAVRKKFAETTPLPSLAMTDFGIPRTKVDLILGRQLQKAP